jgi:hypothetical protein
MVLLIRYGPSDKLRTREAEVLSWVSRVLVWETQPNACLSEGPAIGTPYRGMTGPLDKPSRASRVHIVYKHHRKNIMQVLVHVRRTSEARAPTQAFSIYKNMIQKKR